VDVCEAEGHRHHGWCCPDREASVIANVGSVLKVRIVLDKDADAERSKVRAQVISDGPPHDGASVWAIVEDGGRNRFVLVKRVPGSEPAEWIGRWA
jgi:hypothetical protein